MRRPVVIGNWKMNGTHGFTRHLLNELVEEWTGVHETEIAVCPPYPYISLASDILEQTNIAWGAQDVSLQADGAYTGEVSASMLADCGCKYVIVGHSERREYHKESSELVAKKFKVVAEAHMTPILCVGESLEERESGKTFDVVGRQLLKAVEHCGLSILSRGIIAYEPIWAIGTGKTATPQEAQDVHAYIRETLGPEGDQVKVIYGGSVKPDSAEALFREKDIDGALVGGAALKASDFLAICRIAE